MDTLLIMVTLVSLAMAITMTWVAWKLIREERRRASARIAALAADADAEHRREQARASAAQRSVPRAAAPPAIDPSQSDGRAHKWQMSLPVRVGDAPAQAVGNAESDHRAAMPRDIDVFIHASHHIRATKQESAAEMFAAATAESDSPRRFSFVASIGVLAVLLLGGAVLAVNHVGSAREAAPAPVVQATSAPLELVELHHLREGDRLAIEGRIHNPIGGSELPRLSAVVFLFDRDGAYLSTGRAPIDSTPLAPGQESLFTVSFPNAAAVGRYRVSFRLDSGGIVSHIDRRETPPVVANVAAR